MNDIHLSRVRSAALASAWPQPQIAIATTHTSPARLAHTHTHTQSQLESRNCRGSQLSRRSAAPLAYLLRQRVEWELPLFPCPGTGGEGG